MCVVAGESFAPTRIMENFLGKTIREASFSSPVRIVGFNQAPPIGAPFTSCQNKKEAEKAVAEACNPKTPTPKRESPERTRVVIPVIIKTDVLGTGEAIVDALKKLGHDQISIKIIHTGVGSISENDVRMAGNDSNTVIIGFNTTIEAREKELAERAEITVAIFDIIYKLTEWFEELLRKRTPKQTIEERQGYAKILRTFSRTKEKQVIGGEVLEGSISNGAEVKILRREAEIGRGKVVALQQQKVATEKVDEGNQFGMQLQTKVEIVQGDRLESFVRVTK